MITGREAAEMSLALHRAMSDLHDRRIDVHEWEDILERMFGPHVYALWDDGYLTNVCDEHGLDLHAYFAAHCRCAHCE